MRTESLTPPLQEVLVALSQPIETQMLWQLPAPRGIES